MMTRAIRRMLAGWRNEYKQVRAHSSLAYLSPAPEVAVGEPVLNGPSSWYEYRAQVTLGGRVGMMVGQSDAARVIESLNLGTDAEYLYNRMTRVIERFIREFGLRDICEIGGGREPLYNAEQASELGIHMVVNDIDPGELELCPPGLDQVCFDVAGASVIADQPGEQFDLLFSRMVFEHLEDTRQGWANAYHLLRPGGFAVMLHPTLYALPFLANWLLPESVSAQVLRLSKPRANANAKPKFPAHYDLCFGDEAKLRPVLQGVGFREVDVVPFWGHGYLRRMPVVGRLDRSFNRLAARRGWRSMTSYALTIARK